MGDLGRCLWSLWRPVLRLEELICDIPDDENPISCAECVEGGFMGRPAGDAARVILNGLWHAQHGARRSPGRPDVYLLGTSWLLEERPQLPLVSPSGTPWEAGLKTGASDCRRCECALDAVTSGLLANNALDDETEKVIDLTGDDDLRLECSTSVRSFQSFRSCLNPKPGRIPYVGSVPTAQCMQIYLSPVMEA